MNLEKLHHLSLTASLSVGALSAAPVSEAAPPLEAPEAQVVILDRQDHFDEQELGGVIDISLIALGASMAAISITRKATRRQQSRNDHPPATEQFSDI